MTLRFFHEDDDDDSVESARKFAFLLYGQKAKNVKSLNELRYRLATTTDASMFPPTEDAFKQHVLRAKYQTRIWCESHIAMPRTTNPVNHGWSACDRVGIIPTMYTQESALLSFENLLICIVQMKTVRIKKLFLPSGWIGLH